MKKVIYFLILLITMVIEASAQSDYDCISRENLYILKTGSDVKSSSKMKVADMKSPKLTEKQFGSNYIAKSYTPESYDRSFTSIVYDNGLEFLVPNDNKTPVNFEISSDKYIMVIEKDQIVKVGMTADEIKVIFPKSYAKRKTITSIYGKEGKISIPILLSFTHKNKVYIEDNLIELTLSREGGVLESIQSVEPQ